MLKLHYGAAVSGDQRFDRPALQQRLLEALDAGTGIKMFGLRRIGKSTLRLYATQYYEARGRLCVYIDGQGLRSLTDLLTRLFAAFQMREGLANRILGFMADGPARTALEAIAVGTGQEATALSVYWQAVSAAISKALAAGGERPILVIDELSYLLKNMITRDPVSGCADAERLLASMREWREEGMTMLLTGSIGLTALARQHNLSTDHINDLQPFDVPELTELEARAFIREATEATSGGRWTAGHTDALLHEAGALYPCFLVKGLLAANVKNPHPIEDLPKIFAEHVRPVLFQDFLNQFHRRFKDYAALPDGRRDSLILPALAVIMAREPLGCPDDVIPCDAAFTRPDLAEALAMLVEDGFVRFTEESDGSQLWFPASSIASLWWRRAKLA